LIGVDLTSFKPRREIGFWLKHRFTIQTPLRECRKKLATGGMFACPQASALQWRPRRALSTGPFYLSVFLVVKKATGHSPVLKYLQRFIFAVSILMPSTKQLLQPQKLRR